MTHTEFRSAYGNGTVRMEIDPAGAAKYLSAQLLLPVVTMPVLGAGVALALTGWIFTGITLIATGIIVPRLIKRWAPRFVLTQALEDERVFQEVTQLRVLRILPKV